ncbi:MAG: tetratricopeptide repeat protein [bacterium]
MSKKLERIDDLLEAGSLEEAMEEISSLAEQMPHRADVFEMLLLVAVELQDKETLMKAACRLVELQPYLPEHYLNLYTAAKENFLLALAVSAGREFLQRWPQQAGMHPGLQEELNELCTLLRDQAALMQLPAESWLHCLILHDRVQVAIMCHEYGQARQYAIQLIQAAPAFLPAYNNRSLISFVEGNLDEAIADAQRATSIDPNYVHGLANLTRYLLLKGRPAEAKEIADRLRAAPITRAEDWTKKAEALSYLADDAAVLKVGEGAEKAGILKGKDGDALLLHFLGAAAARLGKEQKARHYWLAALERTPSLHRVEENLNDLNQPMGKRNGAWAFDLKDWLSQQVLEEWVEIITKSMSSNSSRVLPVAVRQFIQKHSHVMTLLPVLLERGDAITREFAVRVAEGIATPEALGLLQHFASGPHGTDAIRHQALQVLEKAGVIKNGEKVPFWSHGAQTEIVMQNYALDGKPYEKLPAKPASLGAAGLAFMRQKEFEQAEDAFMKALSEAPRSASLRNNLASLEIMRGNVRKARALLEAVMQEHPKYVFAPCMLAIIALANGRFEQAYELLGRVAEIDHFHFDEFAMYCKAQLLAALLDHDKSEAAQDLFEMWEEVTPEDPQLEVFRPLIPPSHFSRFRAKQLVAHLREI